MTIRALGRWKVHFWLVAVLVMTSAPSLEAQNYVTAIGSPPFTAAEPVELGFVNLPNGNLHAEIQLTSAVQRGSLGFSAKLVYDSRIWMKTYSAWQPANVPNSQGGWRLVTSADAGSASYFTDSESCDDDGIGAPFIIWRSGFQWTDPSGVRHTFPGIQTVYYAAACGPGSIASDDAFADDSSGYHMYVTAYSSIKVYAPDGTQVYPTGKDSNGNYFSTDANGNAIDTLGRTQIIKTVNGNLTYYDILDSQNSSPRPRITVTTTTINVNTAFGQSGVTEWAGTLSVIQSIALPDGTSYMFDYDSGTTAGKYGLLKTITLPTGGQIAYTYTTFLDSYSNKNRWVYTRARAGERGPTLRN